MEGPRQALVEAAGMGLWRLQHLLLCACAPLCAARVSSIVIVPVVRRPLALVLIVLAPLLGILGREQEYQVISHHSRLSLRSSHGPPSTHEPFDRKQSALDISVELMSHKQSGNAGVVSWLSFADVVAPAPTWISIWHPWPWCQSRTQLSQVSFLY